MAHRKHIKNQSVIVIFNSTRIALLITSQTFIYKQQSSLPAKQIHESPNKYSMQMQGKKIPVN